MLVNDGVNIHERVNIHEGNFPILQWEELAMYRKITISWGDDLR